jgi:hypothetical protein
MLLASACALTPACRGDDRTSPPSRAPIVSARRANYDVRASRSERPLVDVSFGARRDQTVAQARTSLAAMDQKIAALEAYRDGARLDEPIADKCDAALAALREKRAVAAAALDDLGTAGTPDWDTRRITVEKAFAELDDAYKDARDRLGARVGH